MNTVTTSTSTTPAEVMTGDLTREEAIRRIKESEKMFNHHKKNAMWERYNTGGWVEKRLESVEYGNVMDEYAAISEGTGVSENNLRVARRVWNEFETDQDFIDWVRAKENPNLYQMEALVRASSDPKVLGKEAYLDRTKRRVERLGSDLREINEAAEAGDMDRREAEGLTREIMGEVEQFKETGLQMLAGDRPAVRSERYKAFIVSHECVVHGLGRGCTHKGKYICDPHHSRLGKRRGTARKESDGAMIPLCPSAHGIFHDKGRSAFEERYRVTMPELVAEMLHRYVFGQSLMIEPDFIHRETYRQWHAETVEANFYVPDRDDLT